VTVQVQLLGRGTYGPSVSLGRNVSPLWQFFLAPPAQNSVIVYDDGSVVEQETFENSDIKDESVYLYIHGGTDFRTDVGTFEYEALSNAGYTWRNVYTDNVYAEDYDTNFN
jgi:hypothetical protein